MTGLNIGAAAFVPSRPRENPIGKGSGEAPASLPQAMRHACDPDFLDHLAMQFPQYHTQALYDMYEGQDWDPHSTLDLLEELEREVAECLTLETSSTSAIDTEEATADAVDASQEAFPALGCPSVSNRAQQPSSRPTWAAKAAAAASAPAPRPPPSAAASQRAGSGTPTSAKPIWLSGEDVRRFETGQSVAADYSEVRAAARDHARLRNQFFMQATQAYLSGNRALAKQLSAAGREAATEMRAAHAAAATALFEGRNLGEGGRETPGCRTLDLHGLHVAEALERVRAAVKAQRVQRGTVLRLVVGEGRHGKVPARLPAAVRQLLTEEGVRWKEPYAGLLQASF
uniref:Smr domain-containing protein n=1 Tax=Auxenochlorella protothecoides TaxID=3075 RepID=A0A1D2AGJ6_AUXPR